LLIVDFCMIDFPGIRTLVKKQSRINNRSSTTPAALPDMLFVILAASAVSLLSFLNYFQRGQILLYGDAVAHINIARRVFDSQTPGLLQLGTVWLPLSHLLMVPFLLSDWMWRSGVGGSIPSMIAYVFGVAGIFRLTRGVLKASPETQPVARTGAWAAAFAYGANPNLLYLQTTAMTEALYLAFLVWTVVYVWEWLRNIRTTEDAEEIGRKTLWKCALCIAGAELTRYDGWFLGAAVGAVVLFVLRHRWRGRDLRRDLVTFSLGIAAVPLLWLGYNWAVYHDPLEFARGPYSAHAIEQKTANPGYPAHPGSGNLLVAGSFFLKSAELNMAPGNWGRIWVVSVLAALILVATKVRALATIMLLLWSPLIFYSLSIAYGSVPLFLPTWWPHTWYNIRYGQQFLPLFALSAGLLTALPLAIPALTRRYTREHLRLAASAGVVVITGACYFFVWKAQPLCFTEAWVNSRTKLALETSVARVVLTLPPDSKYLMYVGDHVGAFQQAGVPLRQVINEGNHRPWVKPEDPNGLWEQALANPSAFVDFVIAYDGDAVDQKVEKKGLKLLTEIHTTGQPPARIYDTRVALNQSR
jgi:hypothetical protein